MTVGMTGASGVVGGAVLRHLTAAGREVRAVVRSDESAATVDRLGGEPVRGNILDFSSLRAAFAGCEVVYHVAGLNQMCSRDPSGMYRANVDGTRNVLRACEATGVVRLVHTSSAVTIGEQAGVVGDESTPHRGHYLSHYERSKHHAEQVVLTEPGTVEVVCVNPSSVQGPGRASGTAKIILDVLRGRLPVLVDSEVSLVDIDDCARGHLQAASRGRPGSRYILSGYTARASEAIDLAAGVVGRSVRVRMLPVPVVRAGAAVVAVGARIARRRPPVCPEMVRVLAHGHRYDGSEATRSLGLDYTSPQVMVERLVRWFESEGLLK
ncbi:NAD-dependent epimerase/dehydratase family protein [soil metagenome]